jgi:hypothetical protein
VHGKDNDPLKEPFDIEVARIAGQGLKNGCLWIGDGCVDTLSVSLSKIHRTNPDVQIETRPQPAGTALNEIKVCPSP